MISTTGIILFIIAPINKLQDNFWCVLSFLIQTQ